MNTSSFRLLAVGTLGLGAGLASAPAVMAATCRLNGEEVPCGELGSSVAQFAFFGFGFMIFMMLLGLAATIFWIMMIIHAASKPIENRPMWIVIMVLTGVFGALVYYFVVKRNFKETGSMPNPMSPPSSSMPPTQPPIPPTAS